MGPVLRPHAHTNRTRDTGVAEPRLPAPDDGRPGEGQRLTPDAPHNGGRPPPPGTAPHHPRGTQPPTGHASHGASARPPHPHIRAHSTLVADSDSPPGWRAAGGRGAPDPRSPSQRRKATPPGDALPPAPQCATTARKGARCGAVAGSPRPQEPHPGHTGRGTPAARPRGRTTGEGQRLTPDAPHNGGSPPPPPRGRPPTTPAARSPHRACKPRGQCWAPTAAHPCPQHVGSRPRQPAQRAGSRGRGSA